MYCAWYSERVCNDKNKQQKLGSCCDEKVLHYVLLAVRHFGKGAKYQCIQCQITLESSINKYRQCELKIPVKLFGWSDWCGFPGNCTVTLLSFVRIKLLLFKETIVAESAGKWNTKPLLALVNFHEGKLTAVASLQSFTSSLQRSTFSKGRKPIYYGSMKAVRIFDTCLAWLLVYGFDDTCTFPLRDIAVLLITWRCALAPIWCYRVNPSFSYRYQRMHWIRRLRKPVQHQWCASRAHSSMSRQGHVLQHHWVVPLQVQAGLPWWRKVMFV